MREPRPERFQSFMQSPHHPAADDNVGLIARSGRPDFSTARPFRVARFRGLAFATSVALAWLAWVGLVTEAEAGVRWRISVKVFTDAQGARPVGMFDSVIQNQIDAYNDRFRLMARGFSYELTEVVQLDSSLSFWFDVNARDGGNRANLQANAELFPELYAYRDNRINVYINNSSSGICCGAGSGLVFMGAFGANSSTMAHEIGHYLNLAHTQGKGCNGCCPDALGCCDLPGSDEVSDTLVDLACWDRNQVSQINFSQNYASLSASRQDQVDDVWFNLMSYHDNDLPDFRLTPGQITRAAQSSNTERDNVAANYFRFVDPNGGDDAANGLLLSSPLRTFAGAVTAAGASDTLVFAAGTYSRASTSAYRITKACTLTSLGGTVRLRQVAP